MLLFYTQNSTLESSGWGLLASFQLYHFHEREHAQLTNTECRTTTKYITKKKKEEKIAKEHGTDVIYVQPLEHHTQKSVNFKIYNRSFDVADIVIMYRLYDAEWRVRLLCGKYVRL